MKTISIQENFSLIEHHILDFNQNIFINIYFSNGKYAFRLCKISNDKKSDPYSNSDNFSWAYGLFSSLEKTLEQAREMYLENIKNQKMLHNQSF